jgi:diacylglycerol kinase (ATP)
MSEVDRPEYDHVQVIINPAAGGDEPMLNTMNDVFGRYGIRWDAGITHGPGDAERLAAEAVEAGADMVVCYGGDGTLMEVVNGLLTGSGRGPLLGILPGGTGNTVARQLGMPGDLAGALRVIAESWTRRLLDVGLAHGSTVPAHYFLLRAYAGVPDEYTASREMKDRFGLLAYPMAGLRFLRGRSPVRFRIEIDDRVFEEEALLCYVNNVPYAGAPRLQTWFERLFLDVRAPESVAQPDGGSPLQSINPADGLLDVVLVTQESASLRAVAAAVFRPEESLASVYLLQGKRVRLEADPTQPVCLDGEGFADTPVTLTIVPQALEVIAP